MVYSMDRDEKVNFSDLQLNKWILKQLEALQIKIPTQIQASCITPILEGKDCIAAAKTGSGKTLAFALPILQKLSEEPYGIFAVVLTPTRELAFQIRDTFSVIGKVINLRLCVVVGGMEMLVQSQELQKQPHILVATPGRLADHLLSCDTFSLKRVKYLVFDEADRLFSGGFDDAIETICSSLPKEKQTLCFSATITDAIECLKNMTKGNVFIWEQKSDVATVEELKQYYVLCPGYVKDGYMVETIRHFLSENERASIIVFTDTCKSCQLLSVTLNDVGFQNVPLHGMLPQKERLQSLAKFKSNQVPILLATDVASRGLDIPEVELVINHSIPSVPKDYIHRVGRTARAGRGGMAVSIVTPNDIKLIKAIESEINHQLKELSVDAKEVAKIFTQVSIIKREAEIRMDQMDFYEKKEIYKKKNLILEGKDPDEPVYRLNHHVDALGVLLKRKKKLNRKDSKKVKIKTK